MDNLYAGHGEPYRLSPSIYPNNNAELIPYAYDNETDSSTSASMYSSLDAQSYNADPSPVFANPSGVPQAQAQSLQPQVLPPQTPTAVVHPIEFTDLTHIQREERLRWERRSPHTYERDAASSMRIRRRAQNRASQRAFRERKEQRVQHLEQELEQLECKHRDLEDSYTSLDSSHSKLLHEVSFLRYELSCLRSSRSNSDVTDPTREQHEQHRQGQQQQMHPFLDPFGPGYGPQDYPVTSDAPAEAASSSASAFGYPNCG